MTKIFPFFVFITIFSGSLFAARSWQHEFKIAENFYRHGNENTANSKWYYKKALVHFNKAKNSHPESSKVIYKIAMIKCKLSEECLDDMIRAYDIRFGEETDPDIHSIEENIEFLIDISKIYENYLEDQDIFERSIAALEKGIKIISKIENFENFVETVYFYNTLADAYTKSNKVWDLEKLEKLLEFQELKNKKNVKKIRDRVKLINEMDKVCESCDYNKAMQFIRQKDYDSAEIVLQELSELCGFWPWSWGCYAKSRLEKLEKAKKNYGLGNEDLLHCRFFGESDEEGAIYRYKIVNETIPYYLDVREKHLDAFSKNDLYLKTKDNFNQFLLRDGFFSSNFTSVINDLKEVLEVCVECTEAKELLEEAEDSLGRALLYEKFIDLYNGAREACVNDPDFIPAPLLQDCEEIFKEALVNEKELDDAHPIDIKSKGFFDAIVSLKVGLENFLDAYFKINEAHEVIKDCVEIYLRPGKEPYCLEESYDVYKAFKSVPKENSEHYIEMRDNAEEIYAIYLGLKELQEYYLGSHQDPPDSCSSNAHQPFIKLALLALNIQHKFEIAQDDEKRDFCKAVISCYEKTNDLYPDNSHIEGINKAIAHLKEFLEPKEEGSDE